MLKSLTALLLIFASVHMQVAVAMPIEGNGDEPMNFTLIEGDIMVDTTINAVNRPTKLWPKGKVPYKIDAAFDNEMMKAKLKKAMAEFETKTCIRFVEKKANDKDYIHFYPGSKCSSSVGRRNGGQRINLYDGCFVNRILVHEINHALGFYHEQNRSDRDKYVTIHWNAIKEGGNINFKKRKPSENKLIGTFDFNSVMLYSEGMLGKDGKKTMTSKDPNKKIKPRYTLSDGDVAKINELYGCK